MQIQPKQIANTVGSQKSNTSIIPIPTQQQGKHS
jgi:hypothetical protein